LIEHNSGKGAKYTRSRRPVELVGIGPEMTKNGALKLEYSIKKLSADKKIAELKGKEVGMTILKKDLQALNKDAKALERKMEKLITEFDKGKKAKTTKRAPAKKVPVEKRTAKLTATDKVLRIINRSKKGVDAPTLIKKTGFDDKKIRNIIFRTYTQGRVKRVGRGKYVGA
jgi:predicted GIY-YIG superfamily endonuclease